jgi:aminoglycoside 3-N-acetyltransferase
MLTKKNITEAFSAMGIMPGDTLVLQSSYKGCGGVENGPDGLIDTLMDLLGTEGTLIMPAYNFNVWTEQHYFDVLETPSKVGIVSEIFRKRKDVGRTVHPIHSLSVWGKHKAEMEQLDHKSSFGNDSVFVRLMDYNALYTTIALGDNMPFLPCHFTEALMKVPYRRLKEFAGIYLDKNKHASLRVYSFHVRDNFKQRPVFDGHSYMIAHNQVKSHYVNEVQFCYARAKDYHQYFIDFIKKFPELFDA